MSGADAYRNYRFRTGNKNTNPYPDWSGLAGATAGFTAGVNQVPTTSGSLLTAWTSTFGPANMFPPTPSQAPTYDPGGAASDGVNGWPSVNYVAAATKYFSAVDPPYNGAYFFGASGTPWCESLTCRVTAAPAAAGPAVVQPALVALEAYRMACKVYQRTGDSNYYAYLQTYGGSFNFGAEALIGASLPLAMVLTFGWDGTQNFMAVNNGAPVFATAPDLDTRAGAYYNGFDFYGAPVYSNVRISRQNMKAASAFPTAYVAAEVARISAPP